MRLAGILLLSALVVSCNNSRNEKAVKTDTSSVSLQQPISNKGNQQLISELKRLGAILSSGDKSRIAGIFPFPLTDTAFGIYLGDTLRMVYEQNGERITREMFVKHYNEFAEAQDLKGFADIFKYLPLDSVTSKEPLFHEVIHTEQPCVNFYSIQLYSDTVELQSGFSGFAKPDEADADVGCEYNSIWYFRFDGKKLHFLRHASAG